MFVIVTKRVKYRIRQCLLILVITMVMTLIVLQLLRVFGGLTFFHGQMQEDHPSGNPMRVEAENNQTPTAPKNHHLLDKFVIKFKNMIPNSDDE